MDKIELGLCVAALLVIVSHWVMFRLGFLHGRISGVAFCTDKITNRESTPDDANRATR